MRRLSDMGNTFGNSFCLSGCLRFLLSSRPAFKEGEWNVYLALSPPFSCCCNRQCTVNVQTFRIRSSSCSRVCEYSKSFVTIQTWVCYPCNAILQICLRDSYAQSSAREIFKNKACTHACHACMCVFVCVCGSVGSCPCLFSMT